MIFWEWLNLKDNMYKGAYYTNGVELLFLSFCIILAIRAASILINDYALKWRLTRLEKTRRKINSFIEIPDSVLSENLNTTNYFRIVLSALEKDTSKFSIDFSKHTLYDFYLDQNWIYTYQTEGNLKWKKKCKPFKVYFTLCYQNGIISVSSISRKYSDNMYRTLKRVLF